VCGGELALFNEHLPEFGKHNAQLMGISVDGTWCGAAYAREPKLHFPLLADFEPKGAASKKFEVYNPREGHCDRALFVTGTGSSVVLRFARRGESFRSKGCTHGHSLDRSQRPDRPRTPEGG
jgi:peroxiredoxin